MIDKISKPTNKDKIEISKEVERNDDDSKEYDTFDAERGRAKKLHNDNIESDIKLKEGYAEKSFGITIAWISFLMLAAMGQFFYSCFSEIEFMTIYGTTTLTIMTFWGVIGKSIYK